MSKIEALLGLLRAFNYLRLQVGAYLAEIKTKDQRARNIDAPLWLSYWIFRGRE
jgi:hypothetical protein